MVGLVKKKTTPYGVSLASVGPRRVGGRVGVGGVGRGSAGSLTASVNMIVRRLWALACG